MTNRYFDFTASAQRLAKLLLDRAAWHNDRMDDITTGFTTVQTEMDLKAPLASPTLTGTVTMSGATSVLIPTVAVSTNTTQAASTAWVNSLVGSLSIGLPSQATNSGKVLQTDGTSASWQLKYPDQTSKARYTLKTDGTTATWVIQTPHANGYAAKSASWAIVSTDDARMYDITSSSRGFFATLPNATTLYVGEKFTFMHPNSSNDNRQGIIDGSGALIWALNVSVGSSTTAILSNNSTAAGTWRWLNPQNTAQDSPASVNVSSILTTHVATSTVTRTISLGSDKFLCVSNDTAGSVRAYVVTADPATLLTTKGAESTVVSSDTPLNARLVSVSNGYIFIWSNSAAVVRAVAITVSGTTATVSTTIYTVGSSLSAAANCFDVATSSTSAQVIYQTSATVIETSAITLSTGAPPTLNIGVVKTAFVGTNFTRVGRVAICAIDTLKFVAALCTTDNTVDSVRVVVMTVSGTTTTIGSVASSAELVNGVGICAMTTTSALLCTGADSSASKGRVVSGMSATTPTLNGTTTLTGAVSGNVSTVLPAFVTGSIYAVITRAATGGRFASVTASGTTVTLNGATISSGNPATGWGVAPYYDGTNTIFHQPNDGTGATMYLVDATGLTVRDLFAIGSASGSGTANADQFVFRLSSGKKYVGFSSDTGTAQVLMYGGVNP